MKPSAAHSGMGASNAQSQLLYLRIRARV